MDLRDVTLVPGEVATLAPTVTDPDGDALTYSWALRSAPPLSEVTLDDPTAESARFTPDRVGVYVVELVVSDGTFDVPALAVVDQLASGKRPVANAGIDRTVPAGVPVTLRGNGEDPAERGLDYEWFLAEAPDGSALSFRAFTQDVTFVSDVPGTYRLELTVHDGSIASQRDELVLEAVVDDFDAGAISSGVLVPGQVYLSGVGYDRCEVGYAHWSSPNQLMGGLDQCSSFVWRTRLDADGNVVYLDGDGTLRQLTCDACPWEVDTALPSTSLDNDVLLDTSLCDGTVRGTPRDFLVGSDGSLLLYCDFEWLDAKGRTVPTLGTPLAYDGSVAFLSSNELADFETGTVVPVPDLPSNSSGIARTTDGGFHVVWLPELWFVDSTTGAATLVGEYPPLTTFSGVFDTALDADGAVLHYAQDPYTYEFQLIRRKLDGLSYVPHTFDDSSRLPSVGEFITGP